MELDFWNKDITYAEDYLEWSCYTSAKQKYIEADFWKARLEKELADVKRHRFAKHIITLKKLDEISKRHGYPIIANGSIENFFIVYLNDISEVNPLPPHYHCIKCGHFEESHEAESGFDLPDKRCPVCDQPLRKDGHDLREDDFWNEGTIELLVAPTVYKKLKDEASKVWGDKHSDLTRFPIQLKRTLLCEIIGRMRTQSGMYFGNAYLADKIMGMHLYQEWWEAAFDTKVSFAGYCFHSLIDIYKWCQEESLGLLFQRIRLVWYRHYFPYRCRDVIEELEDVARV